MGKQENLRLDDCTRTDPTRNLSYLQQRRFVCKEAMDVGAGFPDGFLTTRISPSKAKENRPLVSGLFSFALVGASGIEPPTPTVSKLERPKKHTKRDSTRLNQRIEVECFQGNRSCSFHCVPAGPVGVLGRCWAAGCSIRRGYPSGEHLPPPVTLHSPEAITFSRCKRSGTRAWLPGSPGRCPSTA